MGATGIRYPPRQNRHLGQGVYGSSEMGWIQNISAFRRHSRRDSLLAEWAAAGVQRKPVHASRMGNYRCCKSRADEPARSRNEGCHYIRAAVLLLWLHW